MSAPCARCVTSITIRPSLKHNAHYAWPDRHPFAWKYDKAGFLQQLLNQVLELGIEYIPETTCYEARDRGGAEGVLLKCVSKGKRFQMEGQETG